MPGKIIYCNACHRGFFFKNDPEPHQCPSCQSFDLRLAEDWEQFHCDSCEYMIDAMTLKMHGNLHRISEGMLRCKYDDDLLHII